MPQFIALVRWGRCQATPDLVSEGAPSDGHARGVVSFFWSCEQTRAYNPNAAGPDSAEASRDTNTVRSFTRTAGTGNVPSRNHRYAVCG
jgi:hypothetical protein